MATFPTTQDVTQFLGSSVGKPIDFNPSQQSPMNMTPAPHPQQAQQMQPSPYMPSGGPYNPYMANWNKLMNGPNMQTGQPMPSMMAPHAPMMTGGPSGMSVTNNRPTMMSGMFSHMPMVR